MIKSTVRTASASEATVDGCERSKGHVSSFTLDRMDCARTEFSGASVKDFALQSAGFRDWSIFLWVSEDTDEMLERFLGAFTLL